jgi:hypothetical protein
MSIFRRIWDWFMSLFKSDDLPSPVVEVSPDPIITGGTGMKKAFLVGINKYHDAPLRGCVNDVLMMYKVLSEKYGFKTDNIDVATDYEATKANILGGLKKLITGVKPGDTIFFHYSGHGSQVVVNDWTNSPEPDGRDEILCSIDLNWMDPLRDNDLGRLFKMVPAGVKILVILDCCHSGTGLRNSPRLIDDKTENDWRNRFIPPPPSNILSNPLINLDKDLNFVLPSEDKGIQAQKRGFLVDTVGQGNAILISGCRENQTSADAWFNGRYHGALTYTLVETLANYNYNIPYKSLITEVNHKLTNRRFTQSPQLESKKEYFENKFLN